MKMVYEGIPLHGSPFSIMASGCSSPLSPGMGDAEASQTIHRTSHVSQEISGDGGTMTVIRREVRTVREFISNTYKENAVESGSFGDADVPVGRNFTMKRSDASKVIATVSQQEKAFVSKPNTITVTADLAGEKAVHRILNVVFVCNVHLRSARVCSHTAQHWGKGYHGISILFARCGGAEMSFGQSGMLKL